VVLLCKLLAHDIMLLAALQATGRPLTSAAKSMHNSLVAQVSAQLQSALKQQQQQQHLNTCQVAAAAAAGCLQACGTLQKTVVTEMEAAVKAVAGKQNFTCVGHTQRPNNPCSSSSSNKGLSYITAATTQAPDPARTAAHMCLLHWSKLRCAALAVGLGF
jgi:hypothetical protein